MRKSGRAMNSDRKSKRSNNKNFCDKLVMGERCLKKYWKISANALRNFQ